MIYSRVITKIIEKKTNKQKTGVNLLKLDIFIINEKFFYY